MALAVLQCRGRQVDLNQGPAIILKDIKVVQQNFSTLVLTMSFEARGINHAGAHYKILFENKTLVEKSIEKIEPASFVISEELAYPDFSDDLKTALTSQKNLVVSGWLSQAGKPKQFFEERLVIAALPLPTVNFEKMRYISSNMNPFSSSGAYGKFELLYTIQNPNAFEVDIEKFSYQFISDEKTITYGADRSVIANAGKNDITTPFTIEGREIIHQIPGLRTYEKKSFYLTGCITIKSADTALQYRYLSPRTPALPPEPEPPPGEEKKEDTEEVKKIKAKIAEENQMLQVSCSKEPASFQQ